MTTQQLEGMAMQIAIHTAHQLPLDPQDTSKETPEQYAERLAAMGEAWVVRSRNLAKLWASKAPASPEVASGLVSAEAHEEISGPSLVSSAAQEQLRRKPGRPSLK